MNNPDMNTIEQLWYTWSDVGLSTIHAGFRIRAASPGLTEIYSERVKNIERNMRYVLPPSTDRSITPDMAPVGLSLIRSDWNNEYLLIHKKYTGADGVGRQGNFFIHALALGEYSRDFSTEDAIWLWEDPVWKTDSQSLDSRSTRLNPLSADELYDKPARFKSENFRQVQQDLQFVIEAYLMRKSRSTPIYIAAPANQAAKIATIITGLTNCLPAQLFADLTFSTYEPDITKATTEIVGTSWISVAGKGQDATAVLPKSAYLDKLAINCETHEHSNLLNHPQVLYNPRSAEFAAYAVEHFTAGTTESLYTFRDYAEKRRSLDVPLFLEMFQHEVVDTSSMDERGIEQYLNDPYSCVDWLGQRNSRKKVIDRVLANPVWGSRTLNTTILALRGQAERETTISGQLGGRSSTSTLSTDSDQMVSVAVSEIRTRRGKKKGSTQTKNMATLAEVLARLAERMIPEVKKYMASAQPGAKGIQAGTINREHQTFIIATLIALMDSCLLPQDPTGVWEKLFDAIEESRSAIAFLTSEWSIQAKLLKIWNNVFPLDWQHNDHMRPLLRIPWSRLGDLLHLGLHTRHPQWVVFPLQELIADRDALTLSLAKDLEQNYSREIAALLSTLMRGQYFTDEANLIIRLVEKGHAVNLTLEPYIEQLLEVLNHESYLHRSAKDLVITLLAANYKGSDRYQRSVAALTQSLLATNQVFGKELAEAFIHYDFPRSWLINLFMATNNDLLSIIEYVYPTPQGQNMFFLQDGSHYLGREDYAQSMISLHQQLLSFNLSGKLERLFILLDATFDQDKIFTLLQFTPLTTQEWDLLLRRYGQRYLQSFHQSPKLASMVVNNFNQLINERFSNDLLFVILPQQTGESYLEGLLTAAKLTPDQQVHFLEEYGAHYLSQYPQMPILLSYISTYANSLSIDTLEHSGSKAFFIFLAQQYRNLHLDDTVSYKIRYWKFLDNYFHAPDTQSQNLQNLARALYALGLPNDIQFTAKLAQSFLLCIQTQSDISDIMQYMREVPRLAKEKADEYRFLYILAEQAAETYRGKASINTLIPYLVFALAMHAQNRSNHFFQLFMDKALYYVSLQDIPTWMSLNKVIEAQGLTSPAVQRWQRYLSGLEIWEKVNANSTVRRTVRSQQASSSGISSLAMPATDQTSGAYPGMVEKEKPLSWLQRARAFLPGSQKQAKDTTQVMGVAEHSPSPNDAQQMYPSANHVQHSMPDQRAQGNPPQQDATSHNLYGSTQPGALPYFDTQRQEPKRK